MPGNYEKHKEEFGFCSCGNETGNVELMNLEMQDEFGRWQTHTMRACGECFGLL